MPKLSDRVNTFTDSVIRRMTRISDEYGAINLSQGFPDFDPPKAILDTFDLKQNGVSPTLALQEEDFVLMLVHTPDYVEDVNVAHTDLALAGHTHGGQVSLFRRWTPAHFSKYGNRFLTGLKYNSAGIPVIVTNGLGTSRKDVRLFTPSEVVLVVLHKKK